ncbi:carbohydrate ABC transporter permease, partial [Bariatricus sp. SGI.154]|uniref:carbohydrate ABC transporter permease n=1 Tax=Bariatricus sp. SGI.154 TaxID=3420549 RepID=UPI003D059BAB
MNRLRKRKRDKVVYILVLAFFLLWTLGPIVWSFSISITPKADTMVSPAPLSPLHPTLQNYAQLLGIGGEISRESALFFAGLKNAIIASMAAILIGLPICILGAYALSRMNFKGNKAINTLLRATLVIPVFSTIVPLFKVYSRIGLIDNLVGLVLVYISAMLPLIVWLLEDHFNGIPKELEEAAYVDGCNSFQVLTRVMLPISYPMVFASALIMFITVWNQYLIPLILAPSLDTKPIAVIISEFVTKNTVNYGLMNAGGLLAVIPPVLVALLFKRFLIGGLTAGAVKG